MHVSTAPRNANGNRKRVPYDPVDVDYFFIITPAVSYLIPVSAVAGMTQICFDEKHAAFAV